MPGRWSSCEEVVDDVTRTVAVARAVTEEGAELLQPIAAGKQRFFEAELVLLWVSDIGEQAVAEALPSFGVSAGAAWAPAPGSKRK